MFDLTHHPYFTEYVDPKSKVKSYVLTEKITPLQKHFYFAQPSVTSDGKYLWLCCSYPPAHYTTLALVSLDPDNPFVRKFPHAAIKGGLPCITPTEDGVYFGCENSVYKMDMEGNLTKLITVDNKIVKNRLLNGLFTHASVSSDGKYIAMDMHISDKTYLSIGNLETGEIKLLNKFGRNYNHAMFSPTDPNLILIDQDWWRDLHTGEYFPIDNRMWLINTDSTSFSPLMPNMFYGRDSSEMAHDYWSGDGFVCWSDYINGAYECDIKRREANLVWKRPICHSHCTKHREYFVGDQSPYEWAETPCRVLFYDRKTNKEIDIFSALPYLPIWSDRYYHTDPHPQFCANDSLVVSTTTVFGDVTVAITSVKELTEKCEKNGMEVIPHSAPIVENVGWKKEIKTFNF